MSLRRNHTARFFSRLRHQDRPVAGSHHRSSLIVPPPTGLICPSCRHVVEALLRKKPPHLGAYCAACGSWIKWVSQ